MTQLPCFEDAMMALSAMPKPSCEPMAAEVRGRFVDCASSVTLLLGSKPGALTIMIGEVAFIVTGTAITITIISIIISIAIAATIVVVVATTII